MKEKPYALENYEKIIKLFIEKKEIKNIWVACGSGTLLSTLCKIFPDSFFYFV
jgi:Ethanolamine utilization protein EutJ (predicted chaperonin)